MVAVAVPILAGLLLSLLSLSVVVALIKYQYHLLYQPLFVSFSYVSSCFISIYLTLFLRNHNGNKVTQLFCVIPAIAPYGEFFLPQFQF